MNEWYFWVPGDPKGQPRPRAFAFAGRARVYDPGTAEAWKSAIAQAAKSVGLDGRMLTGPVCLRMVCNFARPKSHFGSGKNAARLKPGSPNLHVAKPDADNVGKAAADALTSIGVWRDDSQIAALEVRKHYAIGAAGTAFEIRYLGKIYPIKTGAGGQCRDTKSAY